MGFRAEAGEGESPTWANVREMIQELEQRFKGRVSLEMGLIPGSKGAIAVDCVFKRVRGRSDWYTCRYVVGRWPTHRVKTMPALIVRQLWQLSDAMHDYDDLPILRAVMPEAELPRPPA